MRMGFQSMALKVLTRIKNGFFWVGTKARSNTPIPKVF